MKIYNKKIIYYRYYIPSCVMYVEEIEVYETPKCYIGEHCRIFKKADDVPRFVVRVGYPYVDFYSTKDQSREHAIEKVLEMFKEEMTRIIEPRGFDI